MFIGHYGPALAAKSLQKAVPLSLLFIAVQWMDYCWSILVLLRIEKGRIVPGFTEGSPLDLYFMPYTHGLLGAFLLSLTFGGVACLLFKQRKLLIAALLAGAVFSHWLLDLIVHVPDLPLLGEGMKLGFGLWRHLVISLPLELISLVIGAYLYMRYVPSRRPNGDVWLWLFVAGMAGLQFYTSFGPNGTDMEAFAWTALAAYTALAVWAGLVDFLRGTSRIEAS